MTVLRTITPFRWLRTAVLVVWGISIRWSQTNAQSFNRQLVASYADNNSDVAFGSRATIGNRIFGLGGSVMSGRMQDEGDPLLNYHISGVDATARFLDNWIQLYFEYVLRRNDTNFGARQIAYGTVTELNVLLMESPNLRVLLRYDTLEHRDFAGSEAPPTERKIQYSPNRIRPTKILNGRRHRS